MVVRMTMGEPPKLPVLGLVLRVTLSPSATRLPFASVTTAVNRVDAPGMTLLGAALKPMAAGAPAMNFTIADPEAALSALCALTVAEPTTVLAFRYILATPVESVMADELETVAVVLPYRVPALVEKSTVTPAAAALWVLVTVAVIRL